MVSIYSIIVICIVFFLAVAIRCTHLEALLEHKQKEVDSSKNKLTLLQQKYDANTVAFEEQLRTTHDKERQILLVSNNKIGNT